MRNTTNSKKVCRTAPTCIVERELSLCNCISKIETYGKASSHGRKSNLYRNSCTSTVDQSAIRHVTGRGFSFYSVPPLTFTLLLLFYLARHGECQNKVFSTTSTMVRPDLSISRPHSFEDLLYGAAPFFRLPS